MRLFVDYIATKQVIAPALNAMVGGTSNLYAASGGTIKSAMALLTDRAVANGDIRLDLDPLDLLRALWGVANVNNGPAWQTNAHALIDILIEGGARPAALSHLSGVDWHRFIARHGGRGNRHSAGIDGGCDPERSPPSRAVRSFRLTGPGEAPLRSQLPDGGIGS
ncbi:MAG: hypothetical protein WDN49_14565 [Acetobacteraceae bacterium]